jgi:ABC-type iron transport system FetAB ATPase subunit
LNPLVVAGLRTLLGGPFDFTVGAGKCLAVHGPSGSGKTLLLRAIADLDPHVGEVKLGETPQTAYSGPQWRSRVGLLVAESHWWSERVGEHFEGVADGWRSNLAELGFDEAVLDKDVEQLSSGERQRLALLRMLARGPSVLLLDEPTANLDPENAARVEALLTAYRDERSAPLIWVSHDRAQRRRVASAELDLTVRRS